MTEWRPEKLSERIGAALVAPRLALARSDSDQGAGRTASDAALLIFAGFAALNFRQLVAYVWLGAVDGATLALGNIVGLLSSVVSLDILFLLVGTVALTLSAGRRRSFARDFDLVCVAFVPLYAVKLLSAVVLWLTGVGPNHLLANGMAVVAYGWALLVLVLAHLQTRSREAAE